MQTATAHAPADMDSIVRAHEYRIRYLASRFSGACIHKDLAQEGRIAFWQACQKWRPEFGASYWTYARRFVFAAMVRAASRIGTIDTPPDVEVESNVELIVLAHEALRLLTPEERRVIARWMVGESFEDIAEDSGKSDRAIRRVFHEAIVSLREHAT